MDCLFRMVCTAWKGRASGKLLGHAFIGLFGALNDHIDDGMINEVEKDEWAIRT